MTAADQLIESIFDQYPLDRYQSGVTAEAGSFRAVPQSFDACGGALDIVGQCVYGPQKVFEFGVCQHTAFFNGEVFTHPLRQSFRQYACRNR